MYEVDADAVDLDAPTRQLGEPGPMGIEVEAVRPVLDEFVQVTELDAEGPPASS